jgi:hypothetical protein
MPERETKEVTLPRGAKVVLHTYITGRERRQLQFCYMRDVAEFTPEELAGKGKTGAMFESAQNLGFKLVIVSVDGNKDGDLVDDKPFSVLDWVLNLPSKEYAFLVSSINDVTSDKDFEVEKKTN